MNSKKYILLLIKVKKNCFIIKTKDNYIETIDEHKNFNENEGKKFLKNNNIYEVMNPIIQHKILESDYNNFLNDKIWFSVKSQSYFWGNTLNYNLNENDIHKIHFASNNNIDEDF